MWDRPLIIIAILEKNFESKGCFRTFFQKKNPGFSGQDGHQTTPFGLMMITYKIFFRAVRSLSDNFQKRFLCHNLWRLFVHGRPYRPDISWCRCFFIELTFYNVNFVLIICFRISNVICPLECRNCGSRSEGRRWCNQWCYNCNLGILLNSF